MNNIKELPEKINTKTSRLFWLTVFTGGIYPIIWLFAKYPKMDEITSIRTADDSFIIAIAVCFGFGGVLSHSDFGLMSAIGSLLLFGAFFLYVFWSFRARAALQDYAHVNFGIDLKMNKILTVVFNIFYINYCINQLPEEQQKGHPTYGKGSINITELK
ncbi:hypothetical protein Q4601_18950 [Shewanella sp. 1_MG-2023]|uniref:hypothetical protein n=1 Tax=unclassified Shewanella TaxID=196818 RepID=UPI0026E24F46|nr:MULTISPECIES: hypothetical protein [unclassified Shewanella]MDO6613664.1 hypothetical protein [Shewanella sp. 7_MG-2023]MDO6773480.1 hypothetical protein [Shewanella sp. 2_MG-2023]MDO6796376.1 hypothetical protein [Shewanella sp. 1_MG-2023]